MYTLIRMLLVAQSDQGLHCLQICLCVFEVFLTYKGKGWLQQRFGCKILYFLIFRALVHTKPVPTGNKNMTDWQKLEALFDMESNCEYMTAIFIFIGLYFV